MVEFIQNLPIPTWLLTVLGVSSLLFLIFAGTLMPPIISRIPADYFSAPPKPRSQRHHPVLLLLLIIARNAIAILLLAAGLLMLFTPGQGVLTILAAFMVAIFPGKRCIERWIATRSPVWKALNWFRAKHGTSPLVAPSSGSDAT